jgi:hypothetical protein
MTTTRTIADRLDRAIHSPGSLVQRNEGETVTRWSTRAVLTVLAGEFNTNEIADLVRDVLAEVQSAGDSTRTQADAVVLKLAALFGKAAES